MRLNEGIRATPIRRIEVVIDVDDPLTPILSIGEYRRLFKNEPKPPRYRIAIIEVLTCPEDGHVVLVSECGECPRFIKRYENMIFCSIKPIK
ncbi:MAG: hypothetical protein NDF53_03935 [archaeon GB-1867-097]|nr:hypothetical protein [Candidatus Culexmicrobium thermophilum]MCS7384862.1 hypothetical protein [Candidatus Culexmicrobium thermophilum]RLE56473.1 MAG: hypothetical protein DRJ30_01965 [Candidatus Verstraetearchaeota archaeon]HDO21222.1 hypothetical protein [Candidatus Bathyarchaeota archaeon]